LARSSAALKKESAQQAEQNQITITGTLTDGRIHRNNFATIKILPEGEPFPISAVGFMDSLRKGDTYQLSGNYTNHPTYGRQFNFKSAALIMPTGTAGRTKYLANAISGIGPARAAKLLFALEEFYPGQDSFELIRTNPDVLKRPELYSILSESQRQELIEDLSKNSVLSTLAGMIIRDGVGMGTVIKIYNTPGFGKNAVQKIKDNPYCLADEVFGIGFIKADEIAQAIGINPKSPYRIKAAINYILNEGASDGNCFLTPNEIQRELLGGRKQFGNKMLPVKGLLANSGIQTIPDIRDANYALIDEGRCIREGDAIYSTELYLAECAVAQMICKLLLQERSKSDLRLLETEQLEKQISDIESRDGIEYAPEQRQAIIQALQNPLSVITGGPGTGKSTVLNAVIQIFKRLFPGQELYLCAPTGKAAKRMNEVTGEPAKTIHRLLRYNPMCGGFEYGEGNPLPGPGLLIVDEFSMADILITRDFLSAVENLQIIFVGDVDQLPSVGPGSVLRDLINCGHIPTTRLKFNFRQAGGSRIAEYANYINQGEMIPLCSDRDFEYSLIESVDHAGDNAAAVILQYVTNLAASGYSPMQYQVLSPMNKFASGVINLNDKIREIVNPPSLDKPELGFFRLRDKVMVIKNNYQLGVFNGDLGQIIHVQKGEKSFLTIDFGDYSVDFAQEDLKLLTHAYATTIHKSQGAEFPIVIVPITFQHTIMLLRNLLYTALTRAKKRLVLIADGKAVKFAIDTNIAQDRNSLLVERIKKIMNERRRNNQMCDQENINGIGIAESVIENTEAATNEITADTIEPASEGQEESQES
jgi:exodeoxyribonuclease V alpha subunit